MAVQIPKAPIPTGGGSAGVQLVKVVAEAVIEALVQSAVEGAKKKRPESADNQPPIPDLEADEYLCLQQTFYNTLAIQDVAAAIDRASIAHGVAMSEQLAALHSIERKVSAVVDCMNYSFPYVGWLKDVAELNYNQNQQNVDLILQRLAQMTQELTGKQVATLNVQAVPFEPTQDLEVDIRVDGVDNPDLEHYAEIVDEGPQP